MKGFERVGCCGRSIEAVKGARISGRGSIKSLGPRLILVVLTFNSNVGVGVKLCGRGDSLLNALLVVVAVNLVSFFVYNGRVAADYRALLAGVVNHLQ